MASKKQQSRIAKAKRHGLGRHAYEYVLVDEEGREIEPAPAEGSAKEGAAKAAAGKKGPAGAKPRRVREPQPPSLKRLGKRTALFVPVILLLTLSQKRVSVESRIVQALLFAAVFVALMWLSDHLVWKLWTRRQAKEKSAGSGGKAAGGRPGSGGKG